ncbi:MULTISPECIES: helix-turn-helix domain-containing protein [Mycobacteriaceae]|uniref:XRE family transcriptional regulator n=1 Tax=Mycolicibacterium phocaicum TaxID=319706 RepID=A0A7I7ZK06_9MYCO|nr:helix-turn-helix transcriptional regulator [Mycolicibacterium phocaicum]TLH69834.1 XRE family transcriptional regulator [Mycolicibacterium phocaicum]BBZ54536.1 hypothetical protein MPHO_15280 [Mycolicibacterium phocaicum]
MVDGELVPRQIAGVPQSEIERALAQALGRRLSNLREARGLTQEVVAEAAGMSRNHYQLLENGLSNRRTKRPANPRLSTLVALSDVLGVSVPELVTAIFE